MIPGRISKQNGIENDRSAQEAASRPKLDTK